MDIAYIILRSDLHVHVHTLYAYIQAYVDIILYRTGYACVAYRPMYMGARVIRHPQYRPMTSIMSAASLYPLGGCSLILIRRIYDYI